MSTLLQASNIAKDDGNAPLAEELCERALFSLGRITTSAFRRHVERGAARLGFNRPENRQFWLAGYMYLRSLMKKGTYRTALEWAKLLLAVDHRDPYLMRMLLGPLAIRAGEAVWFTEFVDADQEMLDLSATGPTPAHNCMAQIKSIAQMQKGNAEGARATIAEGLVKVPWLYTELFTALSLDIPHSIWGIQPPGEWDVWTSYYFHLTKDLWAGQPRVISMIREVAASLPRQAVTPEMKRSGAATLDLARVIFLEGNTAIMALTPRKFLDVEPNFAFDPLPPPEGQNIFDSEVLRLPWRHVHAQQDAREIGEQNPHLIRLDDAHGRDRAWRAFLEVEGQRVLNAMGNAAGADEDDADDDMPDLVEGEEQAEGNLRLQRIGLQAWILRQFGNGETHENVAERQALDDPLADNDGYHALEGDGGNGDADYHHHHDNDNDNNNNTEEPPQRPRMTIPGAWVESGSESEEDD